MGHSRKFHIFYLLVAILLGHVSISMAAFVVSVSASVAPPALPVYEQPVCPGAGYLWVPGYWSYGPDGYYWVPGLWVLAPQPGYLWTPGYWGWSGGYYAWHAGYWGPHVGFYGGVNYGYGYTGTGFYGGYWRGRVYCYNRSVTNVNITVVHNTYSRTVINNTTVSRVSYNGGLGGNTARPTPAELVAVRERHIPPTAVQTQHMQTASANRDFLASVNHGRPPTAALAKSQAAPPTARGAMLNNNKGPGPQKNMLRPKQPSGQKERRGR